MGDSSKLDSWVNDQARKIKPKKFPNSEPQSYAQSTTSHFCRHLLQSSIMMAIKSLLRAIHTGSPAEKTVYCTFVFKLWEGGAPLSCHNVQSLNYPANLLNRKKPGFPMLLLIPTVPASYSFHTEECLQLGEDVHVLGATQEMLCTNKCWLLQF